MKTLMISVALLVAQVAFAAPGSLDGKTYCRTVVSDGMFGQPKGERTHCLSFSDGIAEDDANTFFGKPPEFADYVVLGNKVIFAGSKYDLSTDQTTLTTVSGSTIAGVIFNLQQ